MAGYPDNREQNDDSEEQEQECGFPAGCGEDQSAKGWHETGAGVEFRVGDEREIAARPVPTVGEERTSDQECASGCAPSENFPAVLNGQHDRHQDEQMNFSGTERQQQSSGEVALATHGFDGEDK